MKFLLLVVFCKLGFSLAQEESYEGGEETATDEGYVDEATGDRGDIGDDYIATSTTPMSVRKETAADEGTAAYEGGEETAADVGYDGEATRDWGDRGDDYVSTTSPPMPVRRLFDISSWHVKYMVDEVRTGKGTTYRLRKSIIDAVENKYIPELCYMTLENITIFNSYLLDKQCLEEFESVSPQCRGFRCNTVRYFLEHGARIYIDVINAPSLKEGLEVVNREILVAFENLDMCTCGRQFFKAAFKCAPYWQANGFYDLTEAPSILSYYKFAWNIDVKSFSNVFDRLLAGFCKKSSHGMCINSIINGLEKMMELVSTTIEDYEDYDDGNRDFQKSQEKRCDALFGPIRAWTKDDRDWDYFEAEEQIELALNKTAAVTKAFYCKRGCRNDESRTAMYPCCLRKMLEDKKLFDDIAKAGESLYKVTPPINLYEMDYWAYIIYLYDFKEELQKRANWTVPARIRDAVMRTVHAAKYCDGKILGCSN